MEIDKERLSKRFMEGDMDYFFREAEKITSYLVYNNFKIYNKDVAEDLIQECLENLWKKVTQEKVCGDKNLFAFIWRNSTFRILEVLRKDRKRRSKVQFVDFEELDGCADVVSYSTDSGSRYVSTLVRELSTVC